MTWIEPVVNGIPPSPRNGHSCTGIGDQLFVFGGVNGNERFNDLHVLDTCKFSILLQLSFNLYTLFRQLCSCLILMIVFFKFIFNSSHSLPM